MNVAVAERWGSRGAAGVAGALGLMVLVAALAAWLTDELPFRLHALLFAAAAATGKRLSRPFPCSKPSKALSWSMATSRRPRHVWLAFFS